MRESLSALLALAVLGWGSAAPASTTGRPARLGLLDYSAPDEGCARWWDAFRAGLRDLGYVEGRDVRFEPRWANGQSDRLPQLVAELVGLPVDVIVTAGSAAAAAAKRATATIPIVMATGSDPVALGPVGSFARPGGNVTGVTSLTSDLSGKRLEIVRELLPRVSQIGLLWDSSNRSSALSVTEAEAAARPLGVRVHAVGVHAESELAAALSALKRRGAGAVFVVASPALFPLRRTIADLALRHRLPIMVGDASTRRPEASSRMPCTTLICSDAPPSTSTRSFGGASRAIFPSSSRPLRAGRQHEDGDGPRHDDPAGVARARGRADPVGGGGGLRRPPPSG